MDGIVISFKDIQKIYGSSMVTAKRKLWLIKVSLNKVGKKITISELCKYELFDEGEIKKLLRS